MADLWKDVDVITADKLNRIVFCGMTETDNEDDGSYTLTLDITPDDILDENGYCKPRMIIGSMVDGLDQTSIIFLNSVVSKIYVLQGFAVQKGAVDSFDFTAPTRSDFYTYTHVEIA